jgi:hypothetical protein
MVIGKLKRNQIKIEIAIKTEGQWLPDRWPFFVFLLYQLQIPDYQFGFTE